MPRYWSLLLAIVVCCLFHGVQGQTASSCPPCDCRSVTNCEDTVDQSLEECDCCTTCGQIGDVCGEGESECIGGLLCLPDDPYSADYRGKCYELTDCLSFGCIDDDGECKCLYSNSCPLQRFPYYTLEECEIALKQAKCQDIVCPPQLTAQDCSNGMYFEQGPSYYSECCPVSGSCVCNVSMCSIPLECGPYSELVMIEKTDENSCCDEYECRPIPGCFHENKHYKLDEKWKETPCKECHCTTDGVYCTYMNCTQLEDCEVTYVPEGSCCPVCFEPATPQEPPNNPPLFSDTDSSCYSEDGMTLREGEMIWPGPCRMCRCKDKKIVCEEKTCEPLACADDQIYGEIEGDCCPRCIAKIMNPTMKTEKNQTMQLITVPVSSPTPTPSTDDQLVPTTTDTTTYSTFELVMVLDAEMADIKKKWNEFSMKLTSMLESHSLKPMAINVKEDMGETVLIVSIADNEQDDDMPSNAALSESELALMVSRTAQKYSFVTREDSVTSSERHSSASALGINESEFNATVIVLTTIAAVGLISFIGVFVGLILVTRRLKTIKAIKGQSYKRSATIRP